ncbi:MAG: carbon-nitrogen hydrolase family protein [Pseudomonadota bacterium]
MARPLTVACLQTRPMPDFESATTEALGLAERAVAQGACLLALPEYCGGLVSDGPALCPPVAEDEAHPVVTALRDFSAKHGVWTLIGSVAVPAPAGPGDEQMLINRGFLVDDKGAIHGRYDKIHMFDIQMSETAVYRESARVAPGDCSALHETPFGKLGHTICYDVRFPHLYRDLAQAGAEILATPAAFTKKTGELHWHILNRARAIENGAYVIAPCAHGAVPGGGEAYGHSLIIDPMGAVLADGGEGPGVITAEIDLDKVAEARGKIPSLSHDRTYSKPAKQAMAAE